MKKHLLWDLCLTFMKIGLFTFGGGYAMIAMMERICVEDKQWIQHDDMMNITVIAESTPGPIAINCATFVGYQQAGFWGALLSTAAIVLPSFLIIFLISMFFSRFLEIRLIASAFRGIKIAVGLLICDAALTIIRKMKRKPLPRVILVCSFAASLLGSLGLQKLSSIHLMLISSAVSLALFLAGDRKRRAAQ